MERILSSFLITMILLLGCVGCAEQKEEIVSHTSPDGVYTLTLYQIGSPQWSFGSVNAKLILTRADGTKVHEEDVSFNNDGTNVAPNNIVNVVWENESVKVELKHFDTTLRQFYTIPYNGEEVTCSTTFVKTLY